MKQLINFSKICLVTFTAASLLTACQKETGQENPTPVTPAGKLKK